MLFDVVTYVAYRMGFTATWFNSTHLSQVFGPTEWIESKLTRSVQDCLHGKFRISMFYFRLSIPDESIFGYGKYHSGLENKWFSTLFKTEIVNFSNQAIAEGLYVIDKKHTMSKKLLIL